MIYAMIGYAVIATMLCVLGKVQANKQHREYIGELARLRGEQQNGELSRRLKELRMEDMQLKISEQATKIYSQERKLAEQHERLQELAREAGAYETMIAIKDTELNAREGEFEQNWEDMKKYLMEAQGCINRNAKLLVILTCRDCTSKKCKLRVEEGKIPEECPLKSAHALHEMKIVVNGFSLAHMIEKEETGQTVKDQTKENEGVA